MPKSKPDPVCSPTTPLTSREDPNTPGGRKKVAPQAAPDIEPDQAALQAEQELVEAEASKENKVEAGFDLLSSYMDSLRHIPLYTPAQEIATAKQLEHFELKFWGILLRQAKATQYIARALSRLQSPLHQEVMVLLQLYRRRMARSHAQLFPPCKRLNAMLEHLATQLRAFDFDKELQERLVAQIRQDVWSRRFFGRNMLMRLNHRLLQEIEQTKGAILRTRNSFVRANLRLVVSVARNFHHYRIPFIDLIQEGNVGLIKAVHRFNYRRGFRFSTYAHWWIRQSVERAILNKASQVRLPVHVIDTKRRIARVVSKLTQQYRRAPSLQEIAKHSNLSVDKVEKMQHCINQDPASLDESINSFDSRKLVELLHNVDSTPVDEALIRENTRSLVRELLLLLNPIEKDIIRRRFGLGGDNDQTLDEIGKIYNLSRERVRQIQAQGLLKIRRMCERRRIG